MNRHKLFCFGHRGACGHEPENTLRSIRKALELGADGIEVDVWLVEGRLVVIHDRTLGRTTNGSGLVSRKSFAYLRSLDAGKGEQIPTLDEVIDAVHRRAVINIELKGPRTALPVAERIDDYVKQRGWHYHDFLVSSFDPAQLRAVRHHRPAIRLGMLSKNAPRSLAASAERFGAYSIHVREDRVTEELISDAHRLGIKVLVYTVNRPGDIVRMRVLRVDGVFTDYPERVVEG